MKCVRCDRELTRQPAATIPSASGPVSWGPKCAVIAGLIKPKRKGPAPVSGRGRKAGGPAQLDWVEELCGQTA